MGNIFDCSTATKVPTEGDIQEAGEAKTFETNHFDANIDVSENLATILEKGGSKRVLLLIGGDWCVWSVRFCELLKGDARIQSALADNFEMMCVNFNANRSLCYQWAPKIAHTPWLAVVDGGGKVIAEQVCVWRRRRGVAGLRRCARDNHARAHAAPRAALRLHRDASDATTAQ